MTATRKVPLAFFFAATVEGAEATADADTDDTTGVAVTGGAREIASPQTRLTAHARCPITSPVR